MNIFIRTDASVHIGTGHVMRCLTLADQLERIGANVTFLCRMLEGHMGDLIKQRGYNLYFLHLNDEDDYDWERDAEECANIIKSQGIEVDWIVVDHYWLDHRWEKAMKPFAKKLMVIDDLANRIHDCDLLLDQNFYENMENRYEQLVGANCRKLLGPRYALLHPDFIAMRKSIRARDGSIKRVIVFFGGSDPTKETMKALEAIQMLHGSVRADVVVGMSNPCRDEIKERCAYLSNVYYHCQIQNMAEMIAQADLAIGAGGSVTWERCYLGLPAIIITVAQNQIESTKLLDRLGAIWYLGHHDQVSHMDLFHALTTLMAQPAKVKCMGEIAREIMEERNQEQDVIVQEMIRLLKGET